MRVLAGLLISFFIFPTALSAQSLSVDELKAEITKTTADIQKVKLLTSLAEKLGGRGEVAAAGERLTKRKSWLILLITTMAGSWYI